MRNGTEKKRTDPAREAKVYEEKWKHTSRAWF